MLAVYALPLGLTLPRLVHKRVRNYLLSAPNQIIYKCQETVVYHRLACFEDFLKFLQSWNLVFMNDRQFFEWEIYFSHSLLIEVKDERKFF